MNNTLDVFVIKKFCVSKFSIFTPMFAIASLYTKIAKKVTTYLTHHAEWKFINIFMRKKIKKKITQLSIRSIHGNEIGYFFLMLLASQIYYVILYGRIFSMLRGRVSIFNDIFQVNAVWWEISTTTKFLPLINLMVYAIYYWLVTRVLVTYDKFIIIQIIQTNIVVIIGCICSCVN